MAKRAPKTIQRETTIEGAVSDAMSEIQSLADEMREAFDNTPESLQNDGVGAARGEAADNLENIQEPDVPTELQGEKFTFKYNEVQLAPSKMRNRSRAGRRDDACSGLYHLIEFLESLEEDEKDIYSKEEVEAAANFKEEVQTLIDEAEAVEFPGMYG